MTTPSTGERNLRARRAPRSDSFVDRDLGVDLAALVERRLAEFEIGLRRLRLRFAHRGHRLALLLARGGDPALQVDDLAALVEKVGLRNDVLGRQRLEHRDLLLGEREAALQAADRRRGFAGFAPRLVGRRLQRRNLAAQRRFARDAKLLARRRNRCPCKRRSGPCLPAVSRDDARLQRFGLGLTTCAALGTVEPRQQLALVDLLARLDEKLG